MVLEEERKGSRLKDVRPGPEDLEASMEWLPDCPPTSESGSRVDARTRRHTPSAQMTAASSLPRLTGCRTDSNPLKIWLGHASVGRLPLAVNPWLYWSVTVVICQLWTM